MAIVIDSNPYLAGSLAPVSDERDDYDLEVTGAIPTELRGLHLLRWIMACRPIPRLAGPVLGAIWSRPLSKLW